MKTHQYGNDSYRLIDSGNGRKLEKFAYAARFVRGDVGKGIAVDHTAENAARLLKK